MTRALARSEFHPEAPLYWLGADAAEPSQDVAPALPSSFLAKHFPSLRSIPGSAPTLLSSEPVSREATSNSDVNQTGTQWSTEMYNSNGLTDRTVVGRRRNKTSAADIKNENQDWLAAQIAKMPVAEVIAYTGMTETAVQNIRRGKSKINFDNLTAILQSKPELRAAYFAYCGGALEGTPEMYGDITRFVTALMRKQAP